MLLFVGQETFVKSVNKMMFDDLKRCRDDPSRTMAVATFSRRVMVCIRERVCSHVPRHGFRILQSNC
jgi:hypothetical protein